MRPTAYIVSIPVRFYRLVISPLIGSNCRYHPTCSSYAIEALEGKVIVIAADVVFTK